VERGEEAWEISGRSPTPENKTSLKSDRLMSVSTRLRQRWMNINYSVAVVMAMIGWLWLIASIAMQLF